MPVTGPWLRLDEKDDWHFCQSCHFYPQMWGGRPPVEISYEKPATGPICIWCRGLVAQRNCT